MEKRDYCETLRFQYYHTGKTAILNDVNNRKITVNHAKCKLTEVGIETWQKCRIVGYSDEAFNMFRVNCFLHIVNFSYFILPWCERCSFFNGSAV